MAKKKKSIKETVIGLVSLGVVAAFKQVVQRAQMSMITVAAGAGTEGPGVAGIGGNMPLVAGLAYDITNIDEGGAGYDGQYSAPIGYPANPQQGYDPYGGYNVDDIWGDYDLYAPQDVQYDWTTAPKAVYPPSVPTQTPRQRKVWRRVKGQWQQVTPGWQAPLQAPVSTQQSALQILRNSFMQGVVQGRFMSGVIMALNANSSDAQLTSQMAQYSPAGIKNPHAVGTASNQTTYWNWAQAANYAARMMNLTLPFPALQTPTLEEMQMVNVTPVYPGMYSTQATCQAAGMQWYCDQRYGGCRCIPKQAVAPQLLTYGQLQPAVKTKIAGLLGGGGGGGGGGHHHGGHGRRGGGWFGPGYWGPTYIEAEPVVLVTDDEQATLMQKCVEAGGTWKQDASGGQCSAAQGA